MGRISSCVLLMALVCLSALGGEALYNPYELHPAFASHAQLIGTGTHMIIMRDYGIKGIFHETLGSNRGTLSSNETFKKRTFAKLEEAKRKRVLVKVSPSGDIVLTDIPFPWDEPKGPAAPSPEAADSHGSQGKNRAVVAQKPESLTYGPDVAGQGDTKEAAFLSLGNAILSGSAKYADISLTNVFPRQENISGPFEVKFEARDAKGNSFNGVFFASVPETVEIDLRSGTTALQTVPVNPPLGEPGFILRNRINTTLVVGIPSSQFVEGAD